MDDFADHTIVRHDSLVGPRVFLHGVSDFKSNLIRRLNVCLELVLDAEVLVASVLFQARLRCHGPFEAVSRARLVEDDF